MSATAALRIDHREFSILRASVRPALECGELDRKAEAVRSAEAQWRSRDASPCPEFDPEDSAEPVPGLPAALVLAAPTKVAKRALGTDRGRAAFVHALAHIEWNAINLALDAVWRFGGLPIAYYEDWLRVAAEEAEHFCMLRRRLAALGSEYGLLPAHAGLWEMAEATRDDVLARMALVPRVLEARGLDVTPALIARLRRAGDEETAAVLEVILRDEIGHVRVGSRWFHHLCRERSLDPAATFADLVARRFRGRLKQPIERELRLEAGFLESELGALAALRRE